MFTLYFFLLFANGVPVQLENVERFETYEECRRVAEVKGVEVLMEMANATGVPVQGWTKCKKEGDSA